MAASAGIVLTESWIMDRINVGHDSILEDIKQLVLPGTFHDKIRELDCGLLHFTYLQSLDLSRNILMSLKGIQSLLYLEDLNLYYNKINSMKELYRLRHNNKLRLLDLRLNPVTKSNRDYRLFLIHLLSNLEALDDRSVRDSERRSAIMHFSTSQAAEIQNCATYEFENSITNLEDVKETPEIKVSSRSNLVASLGRGVQMDDCAIIDDVVRCKGNPNKPRPVTGSAEYIPSQQKYSKHFIHKLETAEVVGRDKCMEDAAVVDDNGWSEAIKWSKEQGIIANTEGNDEGYPYIRAAIYFEKKQNQPLNVVTNSFDIGVRCLDNEKPESHAKVDVSQFAINATSGNKSDSKEANCSNHYAIPTTLQLCGTTEHKNISAPLDPQNCPTLKQYDAQNEEFIAGICDLVDRYWNGKHSLHRHEKFKSLAHELICVELPGHSPSSIPEEIHLDMDLNKLTKQLAELSHENFALKGELAECKSCLSAVTDDKTQLSTLETELKDLRYDCDITIKQNSELKSKLSSLTKLKEDTDASKIQNSSEIEKLKNTISNLEEECGSLRQQVKQFERVDILTEMLEQSHSALIDTNKRLVNEVNAHKDSYLASNRVLAPSFPQLAISGNVTDHSNMSNENSTNQLIYHDDFTTSWRNNSNDLHFQSLGNDYDIPAAPQREEVDFDWSQLRHAGFESISQNTLHAKQFSIQHPQNLKHNNIIEPQKHHPTMRNQEINDICKPNVLCSTIEKYNQPIQRFEEAVKRPHHIQESLREYRGHPKSEKYTGGPKLNDNSTDGDIFFYASSQSKERHEDSFSNKDRPDVNNYNIVDDSYYKENIERIKSSQSFKPLLTSKQPSNSYSQINKCKTGSPAEDRGQEKTTLKANFMENTGQILPYKEHVQSNADIRMLTQYVAKEHPIQTVVSDLIMTMDSFDDVVGNATISNKKEKERFNKSNNLVSSIPKSHNIDSLNILPDSHSEDNVAADIYKQNVVLVTDIDRHDPRFFKSRHRSVDFEFGKGEQVGPSRFGLNRGERMDPSRRRLNPHRNQDESDDHKQKNNNILEYKVASDDSYCF